MNLRAARLRTAQLLEAHEPGDMASRMVDIFLVTLILANVAAVVLFTVDSVGVTYRGIFIQFELFSVIVFTVEYFLRLWSCVDLPAYKGRSRLRWVFSPLGLIDLLAVLPFYVFMLLPQDHVSLLLLRIFRSLRLLRLFKLARYSPAINILVAVLKREARVLTVVSFIMAIILVLAAWGMYNLERHLQPEAFGSIPSSLWWAVVSLTTVGYGDVVPISTGGRIFAGMISLIGIGMISLPAGIMAAGFSTEVHRRSRTYQRAVELVTRDGELTDKEQHELRVLQEELGIDDEEATRMINRARRRAAESRCPHCGKHVHRT
jgi:voltage-gated potassium channel